MRETPQARFEALRARSVDTAEKSSAEELQAVEVMLSGNPQRAIALLQDVERAHPGQYSTAVNLGTAYELAGNDAEALKWITEGMARNSESHYGTEWLHKKILEAKIRLAADPQYLATHRIIPLPERFDKKTLVEVGGSRLSVEEIVGAIAYQLHERMVFVKPPDPVVADLLLTLSQIEARTEVIETAQPLLEMAKLYGNGTVNSSAVVLADERYKSALFRGQVFMGVLIILVVVGFPVGLYVLYRKKVFFLTQSAYVAHLKAKARSRRV